MLVGRDAPALYRNREFVGELSAKELPFIIARRRVVVDEGAGKTSELSPLPVKCPADDGFISGNGYSWLFMSYGGERPVA